MELPRAEDIQFKEGLEEVYFAPEDYESVYPAAFKIPFLANVKCYNKIEKDIDKCCFWDDLMQGIGHWGIPEISRMHEFHTLRFYGSSKDQDPKLKYRPRIQLQRMLGEHYKRKFKEYESTKEFKNGREDVYVLLIQLHMSHLKGASQKKVWRLVTCHADTNLEAFHDQIIGPAMGWKRHYHGYKFIIPTSGATFGPIGSDATDIGILDEYQLDASDYDLRHVLRTKEQRLHYIYDMRSEWRHDITLIGRVTRGTKIDLDFFDNYRYYFIHEKLEDMDQLSLKVNKSELIAGAVNCPPEDSMGCDDLGEYGSILKRGDGYDEIDDSLYFVINWNEHSIYFADDFELEKHQERFNEAISHRRNPTDGCTTFWTLPLMWDGEICTEDFPCPVDGKNRKHWIRNRTSEVLWKDPSCKVCALCFKQKDSNTDLILSSCSRCKMVKYCSKRCQKAHWKTHKFECKEGEYKTDNSFDQYESEDEAEPHKSRFRYDRYGSKGDVGQLPVSYIPIEKYWAIYGP